MDIPPPPEAASSGREEPLPGNFQENFKTEEPLLDEAIEDFPVSPRGRCYTWPTQQYILDPFGGVSAANTQQPAPQIVMTPPGQHPQYSSHQPQTLVYCTVGPHQQHPQQLPPISGVFLQPSQSPLKSSYTNTTPSSGSNSNCCGGGPYSASSTHHSQSLTLYDDDSTTSEDESSPSSFYKLEALSQSSQSTPHQPEKKKRIRRRNPDAVTQKKPNPWGEESYSDLIARALSSAPGGRLKLNEVYQWFSDTIPYFSQRSSQEEAQGWKVGLMECVEWGDRMGFQKMTS